jgi:3'-5' exonuclease
MFGDKLPPSLLRLLVSKQVFKIGSAIKGDITRLKKQFSLLARHTSFSLIDLKEYCIERGIIARRDTASLDSLCAKVLDQYLPKYDSLRKSEEWEWKKLSKDMLHYAARDVLASRLIFEKATTIAPITRVNFDSPCGTRIALLAQEGGDPVAFGTIASVQPSSLGHIRVKTPNRNRLVIDINDVLNPSAAAILHLPPSLGSASAHRTRKTKSGALTLAQLQTSSATTIFQVVAPVSCLEFDLRPQQNVSLILSFVWKLALMYMSRSRTLSLRTHHQSQEIHTLVLVTLLQVNSIPSQSRAMVPMEALLKMKQIMMNGQAAQATAILTLSVWIC